MLAKRAHGADQQVSLSLALSLALSLSLSLSPSLSLSLSCSLSALVLVLCSISWYEPMTLVQGYLAHEKKNPPRTLQ